MEMFTEFRLDRRFTWRTQEKEAGWKSSAALMHLIALEWDSFKYVDLS